MITTYRRAAASLERVPDVALLLARLTLGLDGARTASSDVTAKVPTPRLTSQDV
jgi:hypothetical protein